MEELERLQLNIQLPAGALEGFTRLAEQLRLLAEALGGGGQMPASLQTARTAPRERGENTAFDLGRLREMGPGPRAGHRRGRGGEERGPAVRGGAGRGLGGRRRGGGLCAGGERCFGPF